MTIYFGKVTVEYISFGIISRSGGRRGQNGDTRRRRTTTKTTESLPKAKGVFMGEAGTLSSPGILFGCGNKTFEVRSSGIIGSFGSRRTEELCASSKPTLFPNRFLNLRSPPPFTGGSNKGTRNVGLGCLKNIGRQVGSEDVRVSQAEVGDNGGGEIGSKGGPIRLCESPCVATGRRWQRRRQRKHNWKMITREVIGSMPSGEKMMYRRRSSCECIRGEIGW